MRCPILRASLGQIRVAGNFTCLAGARMGQSLSYEALQSPGVALDCYSGGIWRLRAWAEDRSLLGLELSSNLKPYN